MASTTGSIAQSGFVNPSFVTLTKPDTDTLTLVQISGTYGTVQFTVEGSLDSTNWTPLAVFRNDTLAIVNGGTSVAPGDNTTTVVKVPSEGCSGIRVKCTAIASGTANFALRSYSFVGELFSVSTTNNTTAAASASTFTSSAATALVVGPNGTTNPSFQVDASTGSAVTGLKVKSAASGGGLDLSLISSGSNEALTLEAKGSSALQLNSTTGCTGPVQIGGAGSGNNATGITITPAAAASGVAAAVVSTGAAENLTVDAKGTGTVTLNGVGGTGAVQVGGAGSGNNATGVKITPAAAASGVDVAAVSTGGNEVMTIEAKGTSSLKLNATSACTGPVQIGGAASGNNATGLTVTPAAAASGLAVAVVSTGGNEKLTIDAKGSGTITIGGTSTGIVSLGRGSTNTSVFSGTKTSIATQNATPTAAQLLGGYVQHATTTGAGTVTLDTASNIDTAISGVATGDSFQCLYANTGTQTGTITTNTGLTLKGTVAVPSGKNAILDFFRTGSAAWDVLITVSA